jgi:phosphomannomutase
MTERELRALAAYVDFPAERDLAPAVRARLAARRPRRRALVLVLAALLVALAVAFSVPPARSAILHFFHLRGASIELVDRLPEVRGTAPLDLGAPISLGDAAQTAGFEPPYVVEQQEQPDPDFPTVAFPNPEEPGAMDLAMALARERDVDLVVANDPDADRCAAAVSGPHGWRMLRGDEVGALLAHHLLTSGRAGTYACSIVSSTLLSRMAAAAGQPFAETLTGFKWISKVDGLVFGYEEALGYCVDPEHVKDKDGISAALDFLALFSELKERGKTFADHRRDFAARFGAFASAQISIRVTDLSDIARIMNGLRANPPERIGDTAVRQIDDFADGFEQFPPGDILRIWLEDGSRVIVRPSGTEPKVKVYIDASSVAGSPDERMAAAAHTVATLESAVRPLVA